MQLDACPGWEYEDVPDYRTVLVPRVKERAQALRSGNRSATDCAADSRIDHGLLYHGLTPEHCDYYAGNYRGSGHKCLREYQVGVAGDPRVGLSPHHVADAMGSFSKEIRAGLDRIDAASKLPKAQFSDEDQLINLVRFTCHVFEYFLRVHPYANGNGHTARLILWAILGRHGYWPVRFTIEPRPADQRYGPAIISYRNGDYEPLETIVLSYLLEP
ncbi:MAG: Fic family protein [Nannocystaceae bacterium]